MKKSISIFILLLSILAILSIIFIPVSYFIDIIDFPSFPIKGQLSGGLEPIIPIDCQECPERFPLSSATRLVLSVICYGLLLAVIASIPLCICKRFKSTSFYLKYKKFWLISGYILSLIFSILIGIVPLGLHPNLENTLGLFEFISYLISLVILAIPVWVLAILPASIQHGITNK